MKVLWFAVTPSMYSQNSVAHNGGGWIASLEALARNVPNLTLGIAFEHSDNVFCVKRDEITYYPINVWQSKIHRLKRKFQYSTEEKLLIPACLKVIDDFKPDLIHIFGSEWCFGLLPQYTDIPVVIHMQGSIPPYYNARFPAGYSLFDVIICHRLNIRKMFNEILADRNFKRRAEREARTLRGCSNFMGRTEWDKNLTRLYSPQSKYFYCSEAIRSSFISSSNTWRKHTRNHAVLVTTISSPLYKGSDLILKAAKLLCELTSINFEWRIFGINDIKIHEWKTNAKAANVNVKLMGTVSEEQLRTELLNADIFIHPSYIDNSPNSICEAQLLALPIISTDVGGISSLIEHMETGVLVPSNDPYSLVSFIVFLLKNSDIAASLGQKSLEVASKRHNPDNIIKDLLFVYKELIAEDDND